MIDSYRKRTILLVLFLLMAFSGRAIASPALEVAGRFFTDPDGRVVLLRGVNIAGNSKVPPFIPFEDLSALDPLPGWGINMIRLLFTWEAYEPAPGVYNDVYLEAITSIADAAWERGIYVIIDFHQDGFSRYLAEGCGDGFPWWAVSPAASISMPDNGRDCKDWQLLLIGDIDMHISFHDFYADLYGVRTRYLLLWQQLAEHFQSHEGVIGYDLMNEPWGWEQCEIWPLYEDAAAVIHSVDPTAILFLEPHAATSVGWWETSLPPPTFDNAVYAPHYYDPVVLAFRRYFGIPLAAEEAFERMSRTAAKWNVPLFVGEFGAPEGTVRGIDYIDLLYDRMNHHLASGCQWNYTPGWTPEAKDGWNDEDFSIVDDRGNRRGLFRIRPYVQRIAGTPFRIVATDRSIDILWYHEAAKGATKLFAPRSVLFGSGEYVLERSSLDLDCSYDDEERYLRCTAVSDGCKRIKLRW